MISELPLEIPGVVIADTTVQDLENSNMLIRPQKLRNSLLYGKRHPSNEHFVTLMDSNLLKLFHSALKADRLVRAWDIAKVLENENAIQGQCHFPPICTLSHVPIYTIRVCRLDFLLSGTT